MEKNAYDEAISTGRYEHPSGLIGKYDNVRRLWEDDVTGMLLSPYLERLVAEGNKLRVLDLGCGSGDGYDLLLGIRRQNVTTCEHCVNLVNPDNLDAYLGIDINPSLVAQANAIHNASPGVVFEEMDFNHLPSRFVEEPAYDLYFAGYGTLSHNTDEETVRLLSRIAKMATTMDERHGTEQDHRLLDFIHLRRRSGERKENHLVSAKAPQLRRDTGNR